MAYKESLIIAVVQGFGDIIAQSRDRTRDFSKARTARFATKAVGNGVVWSYYYDAAELFCSTMLPPGSSEFSRLTLSLVLEQFVWCPIVYSMWDIPIATLLNGGELRMIKNELKMKLSSMLTAASKEITQAVTNTPSSM